MTELLLYTADAEAARVEIAAAGGHVRHVLTSSLLVAELPAPVELVTCTAEPPPDLDPASTGAAAAWRAARSKPPAPKAIPWDAPGFEAPG